MTQVLEALSWLNKFDTTYISSDIDPLIKQIIEGKCDDDLRKKIHEVIALCQVHPQVTRNQQDIETARKEMELAREELAGYQKVISTRQVENEILRKALEDQTRGQDECKELSAQLRKEIRSLQDSIQASQNIIRQYKGSIEETEKIIINLQNDQEDDQKLISNGKNKINDNHAQILQVEEAIRKLQREIEEREHTIENVLKVIRIQENKLAEYQELHSLNRKARHTSIDAVRELENDIKKSEKALLDIRLELEKGQITQERFSQVDRAERKRLLENLGQISQNKQIIETCTNEINAANSGIAGCTQVIDGNNAIIDDNQKQIAGCLRSITALRATLQTSRQSILQEDIFLEETQRKIVSRLDTIQNTKNLVDLNQNEILKYQKEIEKNEKMILGMQESIRNCMDLKNNRAKQIAENRAVIQENMEKSVPLEEIIRQKQKIIDAKQDEINRHNSRHESLELPEVLLICASSLYNCDNKRCYEEAVGYADQAIRLYPRDAHRQAVASWILGMISWKLAQNPTAYRSWDLARDLFEGIEYNITNLLKNTQGAIENSNLKVKTYKSALETAQKSNNASQIRLNESDIARENQIIITLKAEESKLSEKRDWYRQRMKEVRLELMDTVEEGFSWLYALEGSLFGPSTRILAGSIVTNIDNYRNSRAVNQMRDLIAINKDNLNEEVKSLVVNALGYYQMGSLDKSVRNLMDALARAEADSPQKAVLTWMVGLIHWRNSKSADAIKYCQRAIKDFISLGDQADKNANQNSAKWYRTNAGQMQTVLDLRTRSYIR